MQYLIRAIKYLFFILVTFSLATLIMYIFSKSDGLKFTDLFQEGSVLKMSLFFISVAAVYPLVGYLKKEVHLNGDFSEVKDEVKNIFDRGEFILTKDENNILHFRAKNLLTRTMRIFEDEIIVDYSNNPIVLEGLRKDVFRFSKSIEYFVQKDDEK